MPVSKSDKPASVDPDFAKKHNLSKEYVEAVERGEEPPPPTTGPLDNDEGELHLQPGGWTKTPKGQKPQEPVPFANYLSK